MAKRRKSLPQAKVPAIAIAAAPVPQAAAVLAARTARNPLTAVAVSAVHPTIQITVSGALVICSGREWIQDNK